MAASTTHIDYPLEGVLTLDDVKLKQHLIQQLGYNLIETSTLVDEITSLVRKDNKSTLYAAAVLREAPHLVNVLLQSVDPSERLRFIQTQVGGAFGLYCIAECHPETYRQILQSVSSDDERLQLLQMNDIDLGFTVLHYAAYYSATETVQVILESVSEERRYTLLSMEDNFKGTPINIGRNYEVLEVMMRLVIVGMIRHKLLELPAELGYTPLHWSALQDHTQCITIIADSVSSQQLIHLLRITDNKRRTPLQLEAELNKQAAVEPLLDYQTKALIDVALRQTEQSGK